MILSQYKQYSGSKTYWKNEWSNKDLPTEMKKPANLMITQAFLKYLPKKGKIIEAGAGLGKHVYYLSNKGYDIVGVEYEKNTINKAKSIYPTINLIWGDVFNLNFKNEFFEAYISLGVIEHYTNYNEILKEAYRVLKNKGLLLLTVPTLNTTRKIIYPYSLLKNYIYKNIYKYPFHQFIFDKKNMFKILKSNGFFVIESEFRFLEKNHMGFYLAKKS